MRITEQAVKAMPERIYASSPSTRGCVVSFDVPSLAYDIEYIRADVAASTAAAPYMSGSARDQALEEAARKAQKAIAVILAPGGLESDKWWDNLISAQQSLATAFHTLKSQPAQTGGGDE